MSRVEVRALVPPMKMFRERCSGRLRAIPIIGFDIVPGKGITLISNVIKELLNIPCGVLMGANLANEVSTTLHID